MARIDDGHPTLIAFSASTSGVTFEFFEKEVTPPGASAGGANDTTTMRNNLFRTMAPKQLITMTPMSVVGAYDPVVYDEIFAMIKINQIITITFPDASTLTFWGWIDEFTPGNIVEGEQPTSTLTIIPSNQDNSKVEQPPIYAAA